MLAAILLLLVFLLLILSRSPVESVEAKIRRNRAVADFSLFHPHSMEDRLRLRAVPNQRLRVVFGIQNSFTTTDPQEHKNFLNMAKKTINRINQSDWPLLSVIAIDTIDRCRSSACLAKPTTTPAPGLPDHVLYLAPLTRVLCFSVVMQLFFPETRGRTDIYNSHMVTTVINQLWMISEHTIDSGELVSERIYLSPPLSQFPTSIPPLPLIKPAYETLWPVVLLTYVDVGFRHLDGDSKNALRHVVQTVEENFGKGEVSVDATVDTFVEEALRLYPPTKRIYRECKLGREAADVESLYHDTRIWGADALQFRPCRFLELTDNQRNSYMPFGVGDNVCPASRGFGRNIIVALVVVLIKRIGKMEMGTRIYFQDDVLDQDIKAPLSTGRGEVDS